MWIKNIVCFIGGAVCVASVCSAEAPNTISDAITNAPKYLTLRERAEQGDAAAENNYGVCCLTGEGVVQNKAEAIKWFKKAAEHGDATAQLNLGASYLTGDGVAQSKVEAAKWFRKAAEQGVAKAQFNLGVCYRKGEGVVTNETEAAIWFRKAAEQGLVPAQFDLGMCYLNGVGVPEDLEEAYKWFYLAGLSGNDQAHAARFELSQQIPATQIVEAEAQAKKWLREFEKTHPIMK